MTQEERNQQYEKSTVALKEEYGEISKELQKLVDIREPSLRRGFLLRRAINSLEHLLEKECTDIVFKSSIGVRPK